MKTISGGLLAHLNSEVTTLRTCWKATLTNGTVYGFTDHSRDLTFEGQLYLASSGHSPSSIVNNSSLAVDNLEVRGVLTVDGIAEEDIRSGLWDFAQVEIFQVNYTNLTQGAIRQHKGRLGEVKTGRHDFMAELRGLAQQMQQTIGEVYSPTCRADLGDSRCGVNLATYTVTGMVSLVTDRRIFTDASRTEALGYFDSGKLTWLTGANAGLSMEVKTFTAVDGKFTLYLPMPFDILSGDTFSVYPGCKKRFNEDCKLKFNNVVNFRGEPHVPGTDKIMQVGGV